MSFNFLPTNKAELALKGWDSVDIILVSGDAYVDHPSFGTALIGRYLEAHGYKVGIIAQPDWQQEEAFKALGAPNLFFAISAGNLDSMIANYSADKKRRRKDMYTPDGEPGKRPDRAVIVYANMVKKAYPKVPIILGGVEASLRRLVHYDYWSNKLRRSLLFDARADLLLYGMAEKAILETAERLKMQGSLAGIGNSVYISNDQPPEESLELASYEELMGDKELFVKTVLLHEKEYAKKRPRKVIQKCQNKYVVAESPDQLNSEELDKLYQLPFTREIHPAYKSPIPAYSFVKESVVTHRGCFGGCSFCTLTLHQGKFIINRSPESVLKEIKEVVVKQKDFKGNILDVGGPSADMYGSECLNKEGCSRLSCIYPELCPQLKTGHKEQLALLKKIRELPEIKRVFINSGIRYDLALTCPEYIEELTAHHVSGQLSMAPEHTSDNVLRLMQKPGFKVFEKFSELFKKINERVGKKQFIVPYFISSHPGCTLQDSYELYLYLKKNNLKVEQVQNFIPIPMTLSSAMYYSELDPFTMKKLHVPKGEERLMQRALLQPHLPLNRNLVQKALRTLGRRA
jgi:uncharacterized radical SAM protein YgiQ